MSVSEKVFWKIRSASNEAIDMRESSVPGENLRFFVAARGDMERAAPDAGDGKHHDAGEAVHNSPRLPRLGGPCP